MFYNLVGKMGQVHKTYMALQSTFYLPDCLENVWISVCVSGFNPSALLGCKTLSDISYYYIG